MNCAINEYLKTLQGIGLQLNALPRLILFLGLLSNLLYLAVAYVEQLSFIGPRYHHISSSIDKTFTSCYPTNFSYLTL